MHGGQCGAELTPEMWLGEREGETKDGGGAEAGATWLRTKIIRDPCTSALTGSGAQDRKAGTDAHSENIHSMLLLCLRQRKSAGGEREDGVWVVCDHTLSLEMWFS